MPPPLPPCLRTKFPYKNEIRKNWVDLVYWCAQLRTRSEEVSNAIEKIEKEHGAELIDQQYWKDHASRTGAKDAGRILRWLQESTDTFMRTNFNHYIDSLVLRKLVDSHINHTDHQKEMNFTFDLDGTPPPKKLHPHELVHSDRRMLLLVAHCLVLLYRVRCHTLHLHSRSVSPSGPVHATEGSVPST